MAAKNTDSHRIFDSYVEKYLLEQEEEETVKLPGTPAIPKSGMTAKVPNPLNALYNAYTGGGNSTYDINARKAQSARQASGQSNVAGSSSSPESTSSQSSWNLTSAPDTSLETTKPGEAVASGTAAETGLGSVATTSTEQGQGTPPTASSSSSTQVAQGSPSTEEKELFKKLHGSDYSPGVGDQRLAELRSAVQQAGGTTDINKIATAAYAQQYAGTPQGQAYTKKAEAMGVRVPRPGEVSQQTNYAQQAQQLGLSPETQQALAGSGQSAPAPTAQTQQQSMRPEDYINMGQQLGLSQSTIDALQRELNQSS